MIRYFSSHTLALQVTNSSILLFQLVTRKGVLISIDSYNELIVFLANESTKPESLKIKNISINALTSTPGTGHTNFTMAHYKLVIDTALAAADTGDLPWNGAQLGKVHKAKGLVIDRDTLYPYLKYFNQ